MLLFSSIDILLLMIINQQYFEYFLERVSLFQDKTPNQRDWKWTTETVPEFL